MSTFIPMDSLIDASSSSQDSIKSSGSSQANKNRKSSLSAVIDKLKSARHVNDESPPNTPTLPTPQQSISTDSNSVSSVSAGQIVSKEKIASINTQSLNLPNGKLNLYLDSIKYANLLSPLSICSFGDINNFGEK